MIMTLRDALRRLRRSPGFAVVAVLVATAVPARRAAAVDPVETLRSE